MRSACAESEALSIAATDDRHVTEAGETHHRSGARPSMMVDLD
jgi:hypothetical protein